MVNGRDIYRVDRDTRREPQHGVSFTEAFWIWAIVDVGKPTTEILERAEAFDTVVIDSHGSDLLERILIGSVAETVVRRSPVLVTVVR